MQNLYHDLENALQSDQSFISDGKILKNVVIERALQLDPKLLTILMGSESLRKHFFVDVGGVAVFDKVKFQTFVSNKAFLPDSYTAFKNKIGLTSGGQYLKENADVVLAWPFKDCVLEGGMTREDKARPEVFWNTTLAPEDVTRLFEPKVLTGWERWDAEAVAEGSPKPVGAVGDDDNLLIKGNNLLALHSLKARYSGKVKLIYIDPPYNTGNDGFRYNDRFNHSAWLTFMRNRLEVARDLLRRDGAIFVNLDDREAHYCKILMDEAFGRENFICNIVWQKKYTVANDARYLSDNHDHILIFARDRDAWRPNRLPRTSEMNARYSNPDNDPRGPWKATPIHAKSGSVTSARFSYTFRNGYVWHPPTGRYPRYSADTLQRLEESGEIWFGVDGTAGPSKKTFLSQVKDDGPPTATFWTHEEAGNNHEAKEEMKALFSEAYFTTPKPEKLLQRVVHIGSDLGDLVLDFFAGSGTTAAVAHKMGRRSIAIEQMDYIQDVTATRLKKVIGGEQGGVSKSLEWQGGGSFVYCELAHLNEAVVQEVTNATDPDTIKTIADRLIASGYVRLGVELTRLEELGTSDLSLDEQKQILLDCLDANQLYVNYRDIDDADHGISEADKDLNASFYEGAE